MAGNPRGDLDRDNSRSLDRGAGRFGASRRPVDGVDRVAHTGHDAASSVAPRPSLSSPAAATDAPSAPPARAPPAAASDAPAATATPRPPAIGAPEAPTFAP